MQPKNSLLHSSYNITYFVFSNMRGIPYLHSVHLFLCLYLSCIKRSPWQRYSKVRLVTDMKVNASRLLDMIARFKTQKEFILCNKVH